MVRAVVPGRLGAWGAGESGVAAALCHRNPRRFARVRGSEAQGVAELVAVKKAHSREAGLRRLK